MSSEQRFDLRLSDAKKQQNNNNNNKKEMRKQIDRTK